MADFDPTLQVIRQTVAGVKEWLAEFSAETRALFLPTGLLDWRTTADESPFVDPASPPPSRVRAFVVDRVLQFMDEAGIKGLHGEVISTDADGIRRVVFPGPPGSVLVRDPSEVGGVGWTQSLTVSEIAGQHQAGSVWHYQGPPSASPSGEIQYTRVEFSKDTAINFMRAYRALGGSGARFVNIGIYDQADPSDPNGTPRNRLAETGATATTGTNSFITPAIGPLVIPSSGFYWLAFVTDTASPLTWATTFGFPLDFVPVFREVGAGTVLPAVAGVVTNPASAVAFVAAVE